MSDGIGLSKRELEREVRWMLHKSMPDDPNALARRIAEIVVALIDKNNRAIAHGLSRRDELGEEDF